MLILKKDLRQGIVKIQITNNEDLWYLSHIIQPLDQVSGSTERKIKIGEEPNIKIVRKKVFLTLQIQKTEYEPETHSLRTLGTILKGPEDVSLGSHHSFNLTIRDEIEIKKDWPNYLLEKLEEATKESTDFLIVIFDRETARFGELKKTGYKEISKINGTVSKKHVETASTNFYKEISKIIQEYEQRYKKIILASPSFWKEYLLKELPDTLKNKIIQSTINSVDDTSIKELFSREELKNTLENFKASQEENLIEQIMTAISKEQACYGYQDSKEKIELGACQTILVSENLLKEFKEKEQYQEIDNLLKLAESMNTKINILTDKDSMKKLDSLGGIAGELRWKI